MGGFEPCGTMGVEGEEVNAELFIVPREGERVSDKDSWDPFSESLNIVSKLANGTFTEDDFKRVEFMSRVCEHISEDMDSIETIDEAMKELSPWMNVLETTDGRRSLIENYIKRKNEDWSNTKTKEYEVLKRALLALPAPRASLEPNSTAAD